MIQFDSQHPHGSSQASTTAVPEYKPPSSDLQWHWTCTWCIYIHAQKTLTTHAHKINLKNHVMLNFDMGFWC